MIRRAAHERAGGFDESILGGMEDWDYWLRHAAQGAWGVTIPEYLALVPPAALIMATAGKTSAARTNRRSSPSALAERYPALHQGAFPSIQPRWHMPYEDISSHDTDFNRLRKHAPRLLLILPWDDDGRRGQIQSRPHRPTRSARLGSHHRRHGAGGQRLGAAGRASTRPTSACSNVTYGCPTTRRFLVYLVRSRQPDVVMITNSELGYHLLPYLRGRCPEPAYCDYCHMGGRQLEERRISAFRGRQSGPTRA